MSVVEVELEWRPIDGFSGFRFDSNYSVNPLGQVRKDSTRRILHPRINQYGVPYVGMMRNGKQCVRSLPRLVAEAYIPQTNSTFDTPINKDGDRLNCSVDNLAWRPRWYAVQYVDQFEDRYDHPIHNPVVELETGEEFRNSLGAACHFGLLEREVVLSILNNTLAWPTFQRFAIAD